MLHSVNNILYVSKENETENVLVTFLIKELKSVSLGLIIF